MGAALDSRVAGLCVHVRDELAEFVSAVSSSLCALLERKRRVLTGLTDWTGMLRYSDPPQTRGQARGNDDHRGTVGSI
jgi:hypothetical protein